MTNEKLLMICLSLMSFSIGIWTNYRSLWLESKSFSLPSISIIISVSLTCSAIIVLLISFLSSKIKIKNLIIEVILLRSISLLLIRYTNNNYLIVVCVILSIICEMIFMLSFYPLLSYINDSDSMYKRKSTIEYFSNDIGIIICGVLFGLTINKFIFNYDTCLMISLFSSLISCYYLIQVKKDTNIYKTKDNNIFSVSIKNILSLKSNRIYLVSSFFTRISYGLVFDLIMIILTKNLFFSISEASIFIITGNMISNILCVYFNKISNRLTIKNSVLIKYGTRSVFYILAFLFNNYIFFILTIFVSYITSKILDNKVTGVFIRQNSNKDKFLFENIRYFIECLGESIGSFLSGILLDKSLKILFFFASFFTIIQIIILIYNSKFINKE